MEQANDNDSVMEFDHFYTNNHIQILKVLLPYIDDGKPSLLPTLIKYMELQYTLQLIRDNVRPIPHILSAQCMQKPDWHTIYESIRRYLTPDEDSSLQQLLTLQQTMEHAKELQQLMELMQGMSENGGAPDISAFADMMGNDVDMSFLSNILNSFNNI